MMWFENACLRMKHENGGSCPVFRKYGFENGCLRMGVQVQVSESEGFGMRFER